MSKARETREKILKQAAELFNQRGYSGSSISDIMRVTGLQKGGIYNHFKSKDELALEAFEFASNCVSKRYMEALKGKRDAIARLQAMITVFHSFVTDPPISGGCPLLNTAIESDDAHPALREKTQQAMNSWRSLISRIIDKGITRGEIRPTVEADAIATIFISTLEGAMMMSKLYGDSIHINRAVAHLTEYIEQNLKQPNR